MNQLTYARMMQMPGAFAVYCGVTGLPLCGRHVPGKVATKYTYWGGL